MKKRLFAIALALIMVLRMLPGMALAAEVTQNVEDALNSLTLQSSSDPVAYAVTGGNIYFTPIMRSITDCDESVTSIIQFNWTYAYKYGIMIISKGEVMLCQI